MDSYLILALFGLFSGIKKTFVMKIAFLLSSMMFFSKVHGSYLDLPRIHFAGTFRADVNSRNNNPCNFHPDKPLNEDDEWNYQGTNEWEFVDTVVTAVIGENGEEILDSPLLGSEIFSNNNHSFGKIVDIDVDFQVSSLYGLEFGLKHNGEDLFLGKWSTSVIVHDVWHKMKCTNDITLLGSSKLGAQSTTRITDLLWSQSDAIKDLKEATRRQGTTGDLSVSITIDVCKVDVFVGRVLGTIGVAMANEPLNVGGERKMDYKDVGPFNFPEGHPCHGFDEDNEKPWSYGAPFKVDSTRNVLVADLGNALPMHHSGNPLDIGSLYFGVLVDGVVQPFGEPIPYADANSTMWKHSGIIEQSLATDVASKLANAKLVVFIDSGDATSGNNYPVKATFPSMQSDETVSLLLSEMEYFVRPMDYYMDRLEYSSGSENNAISTSDFTLIVTRFGQPVSNAKVTMIDSPNQQGQIVLPTGAVLPTVSTKTTEDNGKVTFTFAVNNPIPMVRSYENDPCPDHIETQKAELLGKFTPFRRKYHPTAPSTEDVPITVLPIDGQLYNFYYCVGEECTLPEDDYYIFKGLISILAFSTPAYEAPYTWVDHVKPIFEQLHRLHYIMRTILDMSNYTEVILPHNIGLLKKVLLKPTSDPNYMPTTRDLSPTKRQMILTWLDDPLYSSVESKQSIDEAPICDTSSLPPNRKKKGSSSVNAPRCLLKNIPFNTDPQKQDEHFQKAFGSDPTYAQVKEFARHPPRALFGLEAFKENNEVADLLESYGYSPVCNIITLRSQLATAILLEFFTLPLYLSSMYSIVENCNTEAYQAIREIAMQEMLHFVQAANILIAVGGEVIVDDPNHVPSYPSTGGLPGGVLPGLDINLENFNLQHVYDIMIAIETPSLTYVDKSFPEFTLFTIGQLYKEVAVCINILGEDIFDASIASRQVHWPWTEPSSIGTVYIVTDVESALSGIAQIIEQSEGVGPLNPNQVETGQYGHFYRFEEIVCQKRLVATDQGGYAYAGAPIELNSDGVYPMRDNPDGESINPGTSCHTEARAFHRTYRSFLRVLHKAFNGEPNKIHHSIELMEALQVHAKKCMWTQYNDDESTTCGPVWNYEWN
ncbi:uncharacterized protein [Dysidea avara]|uniref:uncharacterized protein n=1 Tax=Dysidea avara TaxID=196820 RepID=UPI00332800FE